MTKLQLLHRAVNERLMVAVEQIMEMVGGTVLEYEKETIRARKENEVLRRKLRWMEESNPAGWPGPSEPITLSTPDESNPFQQDEGAVNFEFGQESGALVIKTESTDYPLGVRPESSVTTLPKSVDQGSDNAGTSAGIGMNWDSAQSYMAPLDFDPTSGPTMAGSWGGYNKRQRMSFACPDCGKVFGAKQRLMIHMRVHSSERPYTYRQRKACFYGDNKKQKKLRETSQVSTEVVDDLSDASEQTKRSSASPGQLKVTDQIDEPDGLSTESEHTSSDKETKNTTTIRMRRRRGRKRRPSPKDVCYCPYCPQRVFALPCLLAVHMKTHSVKTLVNLHNQEQSTNDVIIDEKMKLPKKQRKKEAAEKAKVAYKTEFPCPECDRVFPYAARLLFHWKTHKSTRALLRKGLDLEVQNKPAKQTAEAVPKTTEGRIKKTYSCPHCDKVFTREGWLVPHIQSQHREVKIWSAMPCSGQTKSKRIVQQSCKLKTETQEVSKKLKRETEESEMVTVTRQGFTESSKKETEESKKVKAKPSQSSEMSNLVVCLSRVTADEAQQSADLPKSGTDEPKSALEQSNEDALGSHGGQSNTQVLKRMFPCKVCGKEFVQEKKFKKHKMKHTEHEMHNEKTRKGEQTIMERRKKVEAKDRLCKMSTSNHNPNTTQTPQGPPNKESLRKSRSQGPLTCPFCGKVFAWEMRLLMHMQIHCGDKPYPYRQRKKRFYGDLKRGQLPKIHNQEPLGNNSDESEQSAAEETVNGDKSTHLSCGATHTVSGALSSNTENTASEDCSGSLGLLPQIASQQPTTFNKNNQTTKAELISDVMRRFSLQPRIVLEPIKPECKYWSSGRAQRSGFDHKQTSCSVLVDHQVEDAVKQKIVGPSLCTMPAECSGHGIQKKREICRGVVPETEIVSVTVCSPQRDSQFEAELGNIGGSVTFESSIGNNAEHHEEMDDDCYFFGVSEKTASNQEPLIITDDELEPSETRTFTKNALSECGKTKCNCKNISSMKLTVMPQTSVLGSLFRETSGTMQKNIDSELDCVILSDGKENVDEDVLSSHGLTTSVLSIQNEDLDVGSKNSSSDSHFPAPDTTPSIMTDDSTCVNAKSVVESIRSEKEDQSISSDPLARDQMDSCVSSEKILCQASDMIFTGEASLSKGNAVIGSKTTNKMLDVNNQESNSISLKSTIWTQKQSSS